MNNSCCRKARFLIPLFVLGVLAVLTFAVHALWNGVLFPVLGVKLITYGQALGILVLAKILFGGFPRRGGRFGAKEWMALTPAQREEMREEMRRRFGDWPRPYGCGKGDEPKATP